MSEVGEDDVFNEEIVVERKFTKKDIETLLMNKSPRLQLETLKGSFSEVWKFCGVALVDGKKTGFAACRTCDCAVYKYDSTQGTASLRNHVAKYCKTVVPGRR